MTIAIGITLCILGVVLGVVLAQRLSPAPRGELLLRAQETAEAELRARREEIEREVQRLGKQEAAQTRKAEILASREEEQSRRDRNLQNREQAAEQAAKRAEDFADQAAKRLEQIAGLNVEQARAKLRFVKMRDDRPRSMSSGSKKTTVSKPTSAPRPSLRRRCSVLPVIMSPKRP